MIEQGRRKLKSGSASTVVIQFLIYFAILAFGEVIAHPEDQHVSVIMYLCLHFVVHQTLL